MYELEPFKPPLIVVRVNHVMLSTGMEIEYLYE
jgi:hypothetical protein